MAPTMADSAQDRNLPATAKRKERAREDGQVPRSRDLSHFASLGMAAGLLAAGGPLLARVLRDALADALRFQHDTVAEPGAMFVALGGWLKLALSVIVPLGLLVVVAAIGATVLSGGWNVSFKPLKPKAAMLHPIKGLGRLVSKQHLVDTAKMLLLAVVIVTTAVLYLRKHYAELAGLLAVPLPAAIEQLAVVIGIGFALMLLSLAIWSVIDVPLQRWLWENRLKMTREEVKQEHKDAEGSPEVKGRIKARMREMARKRMLAAVPLADLVVMNPTHYAVALKYDEGRMGAPRVVAKGTDLLALRIRDIAREAGVPVLEAPPLARALHAHCELEQEVPAALFAAVAQVLAWVYQLKRQGRHVAPPQVNVPAELDPHNSRPSV